MALIKCRYCGEDVSEKAKVCPHCGAALLEEPAPKPLTCEECGTEIPEGRDSCPKCGCPVSKKEETATGSSSIQATQTLTVIASKTLKTIAIVIAAILLIVGIVVINQNVLTGNDKVAYELVLDVANNFKNPSSVRLVSGTVGVDKDYLFAGISATNGWGARTTSYYSISKGGWIFEEEDPISIFKATDTLNISKINKKLEKALGSY